MRFDIAMAILFRVQVGRAGPGQHGNLEHAIVVGILGLELNRARRVAAPGRERVDVFSERAFHLANDGSRTRDGPVTLAKPEEHFAGGAGLDFEAVTDGHTAEAGADGLMGSMVSRPTREDIAAGRTAPTGILLKSEAPRLIHERLCSDFSPSARFS